MIKAFHNFRYNLYLIIMLEEVNHIAIAVPDLLSAINNYKNTFNCDISKIIKLPKHGVSTAFIYYQILILNY